MNTTFVIKYQTLFNLTSASIIRFNFVVGEDYRLAVLENQIVVAKKMQMNWIKCINRNTPTIGIPVAYIQEKKLNRENWDELKRKLVCINSALVREQNLSFL